MKKLILTFSFLVLLFGTLQASVSIMYLANLHTSFLCNLIYPTFSKILLYSC